MFRIVILLALVSSFIYLPAQAISVSNITKLEGEHDNPIMGRGLVAGLVGTGDQGDIDKIKAELALLKSLGTDLNEADITSKNVAYVLVQGNLTPYMKPGQKITVKVMSKGSAKSIKNGILLPTLLNHPYLQKDKVFAIAYGAITVDPKSPNTGTVQAVIEEGVPVTYITEEAGQKYFYLNLSDPNFSNASTIANDINLLYGSEGGDNNGESTQISSLATPLDATRIRVKVPKKWDNNFIDFIALVQKIPITDYVTEARVLVNSRTGTVLINGAVTLDSVAIAHGDLIVKVLNPGAGGAAQTQNNSLAVMQPGVNLDSLVSSLNVLGVKPDDLVALLEKLHKIGALHAKLEIE